MKSSFLRYQLQSGRNKYKTSNYLRVHALWNLQALLALVTSTLLQVSLGVLHTATWLVVSCEAITILPWQIGGSYIKSYSLWTSSSKKIGIHITYLLICLTEVMWISNEIACENSFTYAKFVVCTVTKAIRTGILEA